MFSFLRSSVLRKQGNGGDRNNSRSTQNKDQNQADEDTEEDTETLTQFPPYGSHGNNDGAHSMEDEDENSSVSSENGEELGKLSVSYSVNRSNAVDYREGSSCKEDDLQKSSTTVVSWMPDELCQTCYSCDAEFTVFRRRHHCRLCGQIFCSNCAVVRSWNRDY